MAEEYVGAVVLEWDGKEIECLSMSVKCDTGKRPVKTMNRKKRVKGHAQGIVTYELDVEVAIPRTGDLDWENMQDAKLTEFPVDDEEQRTTYYGCECTGYSEKYVVDGHAVRSLTISALDKKKE
ncbi:hypothetical protein [Azonexus sp. R2A61]|uniref:hypothetical protein n=1 Tax=Azonexus sp. R2A61 TaxID=2744443 RepID=UPI001F298A42|nr:hypothetical protein [Azonexus sp. R2A61]